MDAATPAGSVRQSDTRQFGEALVTYDYRDPEAHRDAVLGLATGSFREEYQDAFDQGLGDLMTVRSAGEVLDGSFDPKIVAGKDVIATVRNTVGATNPAQAAPGTIRGDFGVEFFELTVVEK